MTPLVMYHMLNWGHNATILSEIRPILIEARDKADAEEWGYKDTGRNIPEMGIRLSVTKMHGQDTTVLAAGHNLCNTSESVYIYNVQWKKLNFYRILSNKLKKLICSHRGGEIMWGCQMIPSLRLNHQRLQKWASMFSVICIITLIWFTVGLWE